jgi:hypothetical protein
VDIKQWVVDSGQWTVNSGQRAMGTRRTEPSGIWSVRYRNFISWHFDLAKFDIFTKSEFCDISSKFHVVWDLEFCQTDHCLLPTFYCPLCSVHYPLFTVLCLLPPAHYPCPTFHCPLSTAYQPQSQNLCPLSANLNYFPQAVVLFKKLTEPKMLQIYNMQSGQLAMDNGE